MMILTKEDAVATAQVMVDKKGYDIVLLEISHVAAFADYFVICSGRSSVQVKAIVNALEAYFREKGIRPFHIEGYTEGRWVLMDYDEVIVHVFLEEARDFYDLERLWNDVPRTDFDDYRKFDESRKFDNLMSLNDE
jgi:ribosome-associated protein